VGLGSILLALFLVTAMGFAMKLYLLQEILAVLFVLGILTVTILLIVVASILFREGIRHGIFWIKAKIGRLAGLDPVNVASNQPIAASLPLKESKLGLHD
jgi:hypothetical protein